MGLATGIVVPMPASAAATDVSGCQYRQMCVINDGRIVYSAVGSSDRWPSDVEDVADRVVNNGSSYDLVVFQQYGGDSSTSGWALCIPKGRDVALSSLKPAVPNQASSHRWMAGGYCDDTVRWIREPGASPSFVADVVKSARSQLGVREVPDNHGSRVRTFQKSVQYDHYALDAPWCASFVTWAELQANDPTPFRSALVSDWISAAEQGRAGMSIVRQSDARPGDLVVFRKYRAWQHMGIVTSVRDGITVVSGNTVAPDQRADGVFEKPLTNWTKKGFAVTFIRNDS